MSGIPTLGRIVYFRSRTGNYTLSAEVIGTQASIAPRGIELGHVPALSSPFHVHLLVRSPALIAPLRTEAQDFIDGSDATVENPVNGLYREWNVPPMSVEHDTPCGRCIGTIGPGVPDYGESVLADFARQVATAKVGEIHEAFEDDVESPVPMPARTWGWPRRVVA